ncbi:BsuBI/PstI family type II restriction endonuclease [Cyanothece sp. BG0011]|uniref:BsuBI/PstI family type II restriction endonuclease n=1 Tax=Cyanothece sp. BG0011 TaxID=2082950 RepID=UPI000D1EA4A8|nr:BsuBI/PstI family type II restriction endonuclease [Cyanothece sp. BG0011]
MNHKDYIAKSTKNTEIKLLINEALLILDQLGIPLEKQTTRRLERLGMAFLAVANIKNSQDWKNVQKTSQNHGLRTREIIKFWNTYFDENISESSYDDIRRKDLKLLVLSEIVIASAANPNAARNDGTRAFALNPNYAIAIETFGTHKWDYELNKILKHTKTLKTELSESRSLDLVPIIFPSGKVLELSPGKHNELQKAIVELFLPRYGYGAEVLYIGDTANKFLHLDQDKLNELKFFEISHGELPDIIAYSHTKNWLYLIEAVHSSGVISPIRLLSLKRLTENCQADLIFVTAFLDKKTFRKFVSEIAWETEVWIAESPDHLIHFDGEKFLGSY